MNSKHHHALQVLARALSNQKDFILPECPATWLQRLLPRHTRSDCSVYPDKSPRQWADLQACLLMHHQPNIQSAIIREYQQTQSKFSYKKPLDDQNDPRDANNICDILIMMEKCRCHMLGTTIYPGMMVNIGSMRAALLELDIPPPIAQQWSWLPHGLWKHMNPRWKTLKQRQLLLDQKQSALLKSLAHYLGDQHSFQSHIIQYYQDLYAQPSSSTQNKGTVDEQFCNNECNEDQISKSAPNPKDSGDQHPRDHHPTPVDFDKTDLSPTQGEQDLDNPDPTEENHSPSSSTHPHRANHRRPIQLQYRVFTKQHDKVISAGEWIPPELLKTYDQQLLNEYNLWKKTVRHAAQLLRDALMSPSHFHWVPDFEEGHLDPKKIKQLVIDPTYKTPYRQWGVQPKTDTAVTLLIDNSGSMRGKPILMAALSAYWLSHILEQCQVKTEILGFTTQAWKGGQSRTDWLAQNKPAHPGRLNDLLHVVYKPFSRSLQSVKSHFGLMLHEPLLKENIDGEALAWAYRRLIKQPCPRKILMVISDGAPVDDSTLAVHVPTYLEDHLLKVIQSIEQQKMVDLTAIGIGHDVSKYYKKSVVLHSVDQLGEGLAKSLLKMLKHPLN